MQFVSGILMIVALLGLGLTAATGCSNDRGDTVRVESERQVETTDDRAVEVEVEEDGDVEVEQEGPVERGLEAAGRGVGKGIEEAGEGMDKAGEWVQEKSD